VERDSENISAREYAKARLFEWGSCIRTLTMRGAPNPNMYNRSAFYNAGVVMDRNRIQAQHFDGISWARATEVDEILAVLRDSKGSIWDAIVIRYVMREPGGAGRRMEKAQQVRLWYQRTGLGSYAYYQRLRTAESFIGTALGR
jgi:hypothetical protein